jgi:3',5'-cyclic AMP phosphodiesterase CpdA
MRADWLTDIHLNFLKAPDRAAFYEELAARPSHAILITGDIAESRDAVACLREMEQVVRRPIYFVLGNHDFYGGSIARVRQEAAQASAGSEFLVYLSAGGVVELSPQTALVGHDGWGDARLGDFARSNVSLSDFYLIEDFAVAVKHPMFLDKFALRPRLERLGDEAAEHLARVLPEAMAAHRRVVVLTHVPPFRKAAWYAGTQSDDNWLPYFACKAVGDVLLGVCAAHPRCELLVLCGHTHGVGETQIAENLRVLTGGARYGQPEVQREFEFD